MSRSPAMCGNSRAWALRAAGRVAVVMAALATAAPPALAQLDGPRVSWTLPKLMNVLGVTAVRGDVNAIWTKFNLVEPGVRIDNALYFLSFSRSQPVFGRSAVFTALLPAGSIGTDATLPAGTGDDFVHGVGDPSLSGWVNLVGAPGLKVKDFTRFEQMTTVALSAAVTFPVGQYDGGSILNIGGNQWRFRFGVPVVQALGAWVPGKRLTLEVLPSLTVVSDNTDARGQTIRQDPTLVVETHLTRDVTKRAFLSLDYSFLRLGATTTSDNQTDTLVRAVDARTAHLVGVTAGFEISDNLTLYLTHLQTAGDNIDALDLDGSLFKATLTYAWHSVLEHLRNLHE